MLFCSKTLSTLLSQGLDIYCLLPRIYFPHPILMSAFLIFIQQHLLLYSKPLLARIILICSYLAIFFHKAALFSNSCIISFCIIYLPLRGYLFERAWHTVDAQYICICCTNLSHPPEHFLTFIHSICYGDIFILVDL